MLVQRCRLEFHRLIVPVSISRHAFDQDALGPSAFSVSRSEYRALIDTGAQRTVLTEHVISQEKLTRIGHAEFSSLHGPQTHSRYLASIGFWGIRETRPVTDLERETSLYMHAHVIEPVNMNNHPEFDILLGMDVLKHYNFTFDRDAAEFRLELSS